MPNPSPLKILHKEITGPFSVAGYTFLICAKDLARAPPPKKHNSQLVPIKKKDSFSIMKQKLVNFR